MTTAIERAADLLFGNPERQLRNIRFLCGGDANVSAEQLAEQILLSEEQRGNGHATHIVDVDAHLTALRA